MTNLSGLPPLGLKQPRADDNPAYLAAVRQMPCIICEEWGLPQLSPTTAHHPIHDRHSQRKRPDITAIPLCDGHHSRRLGQQQDRHPQVTRSMAPSLWR